ncbi:hypothetical protein [Propionimicrobium sp. PCR01-08-3]|uniref:hypothetical protein n=1 Tax=Propionimicrobium sp. PCR01-08-3 TaxID=3052086 RepID=UPI00255C7707|nr:hypothetical protein [Propionimicrobium sp. PCR01-08-3]WIY82514.1 hypothetical protein QQ658_13580 [Propionimicrobium sp. PCR01-08-3]
MNSLLLVDPQLGRWGLGVLSEHLPDAIVAPVAAVNSILALAQAADSLKLIKSELPSIPAIVIARGTGCSVAARFAADHDVNKALLIDPISTSTRDEGFHVVNNADTRRLERIADGLANPAEPAQADVDVWTDPRIAEGVFPDEAYELLARGLSDRQDVRDRIEQAWRECESKRQPYDDARWTPTPESIQELDWLASAREANPGTVTIWLSHDAEGRPPSEQVKYLARELPVSTVVEQPWEEYDFMVDPQPLADAISDWLVG